MGESLEASLASVCPASSKDPKDSVLFDEYSLGERLQGESKDGRPYLVTVSVEAPHMQIQMSSLPLNTAPVQLFIQRPRVNLRAEVPRGAPNDHLFPRVKMNGTPLNNEYLIAHSTSPETRSDNGL